MAALEQLTPDTQEALQRLFEYAQQVMNMTPAVTSTLRTCAKQNELYAQGRTAPGAVVTNARGCLSWHVLARAVDITLPGGKVEDYEELGIYWENLGGYWGGRIQGLGDWGHFEWHPGYRIEQLCPNPDNCSGAVERSRALHLPPPKLGGAIKNKGLVIVGVALAVFGVYWAVQSVSSSKRS